MINDKNLIVARCTKCESEYTEEEIKGHFCCPNCQTAFIPLNPENDVTIKINLHELRTAFLWAENYCFGIDNKKENLDNPNYESLRDVILRTAARIRKQLLPKYNDFPLTWKDEMDMLEKAGHKADLFIDGKEII